MSRESEQYIGGYQRVLPRDAFNEGNLMTNIGRLWILLDEHRDHDASIVEEDVEQFDIRQNDATGGLTVTNLTFLVGGTRHYLERPLNSRDKWPLLVSEKDGDEDFEPVEIFNDEGGFSAEMLQLIGAKREEAEAEAETGPPHAELIGRLLRLSAQREHEQRLSRADHPQALHVSVAGENRVNRQIANLLPEIIEALAGKTT